MKTIIRVFADWFAAAWQIVRYAPWLLLPILLTEGIQHVVEIQLGMFQSRGAFIDLSDDPSRMAFGYAKVAGLLISMLLVARASALGSAKRAMTPHWRSLIVFAAIIALTFALDLGFQSAPARAIAPDWALQGINMILQSAAMIVLLAALFEDNWVTLRAARWRAVGAFILSGLLAALALIPMQLLHGYNHTLALGGSPPRVWGLMAFDTVWTAGIALMVGTGMAVGWRRFIPREGTEKMGRPEERPSLDPKVC
jgi:hypothetical protein